MATKTADPQATKYDTLYDVIHAWGLENVRDEVPSKETLHEVEHALHAVNEFLVEPIATALKRVARKTTVEDLETAGPLIVDYEDIGRLIIWTDDLRLECSYLLDSVTDITLLAHEDLQQLAEGFRPGNDTLGDPGLKAQLRRFHGLNELRW